jgi:hypothetical protein
MPLAGIQLMVHSMIDLRIVRTPSVQALQIVHGVTLPLESPLYAQARKVIAAQHESAYTASHSALV